MKFRHRNIGILTHSRALVFFIGGFAGLFVMLGFNQLFVIDRAAVLQSKINTFLGVQSDVSVSSWSELSVYLKRAMFGKITPNNLPTVNLEISQKQILKLNYQQSKQRVYVKAKVGTSLEDVNSFHKAKIRLKGDRKLHNENVMRQSYRVNLAGDARIFGLEEFSIQNPIVRGYSWELLISKVFSSEGMLTLDTLPVNFSVNGDPRGIYFVEEVPDARTVERQGRKAGPIFGLEEKYGTSMDSILDVYEKSTWHDNQIYIYASDVLYREFANAINGEGFKSSNFDFDEWAKFFALHDLFGSYHGTVPKSVRFYYNPVLGKFQPILFDAHKGAGNFKRFILGDLYLSKKTDLCDWICDERSFYLAFFRNSEFREYYTRYLNLYSSKSFRNKIKHLYEVNFKHLDNKFYSNLSATDGIFFRGMGLYFLNLTDLDVRALQMERALLLFEHNSKNEIRKDETFSVGGSNSSFKLKVSENVKILEWKDINFQGKQLIFEQPTLVLLTGSNRLAGLSEKQRLLVSGPVTFVQLDGKINLENLIFDNLSLVNVENRNWSGLINIINSETIINGVEIIGGDAEDSINIISSNFIIHDLFVENSLSDAVDLDFSSGKIGNLYCKAIGNDCLDTSGSKVEVQHLQAETVGDKGVSAGENSRIKIEKAVFSNIGVGLVSKDGSVLDVKNMLIDKTPLAVSAYIKKPEYKAPSVILNVVTSPDSSEVQKALIGLEANYQLPTSFIVFKEPSLNIENRMYGIEFGKKTLK